jgi:hypothetical protein
MKWRVLSATIEVAERIGNIKRAKYRGFPRGYALHPRLVVRQV